MGVRNSWLARERNSLFACIAAASSAQIGVETEDAFSHLHAGREFLLFKGLGHKVIRTGGHRFEVVRLPGARG